MSFEGRYCHENPNFQHSVIKVYDSYITTRVDGVDRSFGHNKIDTVSILPSGDRLAICHLYMACN